MNLIVLAFQDIDKTELMDFGGKSTTLGGHTRIEGIHVPDGFAFLRKLLKGLSGKRIVGG